MEGGDFCFINKTFFYFSKTKSFYAEEKCHKNLEKPIKVVTFANLCHLDNFYRSGQNKIL